MESFGAPLIDRYTAVSRSLRRHLSEPPRAEKQKNYLKYFVDPIGVSMLESNANQLVYGRGGSGKTALFGALNAQTRERFPIQNVYSFYYSATDFRTSPSGEYSVADKTHAFFHSFIQSLCADITGLADKLLGDPGWVARVFPAGDENAKRRDRLETAVLNLMEASSYGVEVALAPPSTQRELTTTKRGSGKFEIGASASVDGNVGARVGGGFSKESERESRERTIAEVSRGFSAARIRELVVEIVELLDLSYIKIFIDEWVTLDECQVEFADRLKRSLFSSEKIAVKIAADQYQGRVNNAGHGQNFRGIEIARDIFVVADLDEPFLDAPGNQSLYAQMLYRRLVQFEPSLVRHFGEPPLSDPDTFIETIFATRQAFVELCAGAHGLCREFLLALQRCAKQMNATVTSNNRIDIDCVRRAIVEGSQGDRMTSVIDSTYHLNRAITNQITKSRSQYFVVKAGPSAFTPALNDLLSKRSVHRQPTALVHPSIRQEYDCYEVNFGWFIDRMQTAEFETGESIDPYKDRSEIKEITSLTVHKYLLDLEGMQQESSKGVEMILCTQCAHEFDCTEKAYSVAGVCPMCFLPPTNEG